MSQLYKTKYITIILIISSLIILGSCTNNYQINKNDTSNNIENNEENRIEEINETEPTDEQIDELIDLIFEIEN